MLQMSAIHSPRIALVGPCSSGKSTLGSVLKQMGYEVRQVAQEHSYVPNMWQRISQPDILIYLDVDYATMRARRPPPTAG
jgi:deoxyadenosine/deoxycytidine kinase